MNTPAPGTVFLVNDDPSQLRLAEAILGADGLKVSSCNDAQEALIPILLEAVVKGSWFDRLTTNGKRTRSS